MRPENKEARLKKQAEEFRKNIEAKGNEWELITEYKGSHELITAKHKPCGTIRTCEARRLLTQGCEPCRRQEYSQKRAEERWTERIPEIEKKYNVSAVSQYNGYREKMTFSCKICGRLIEKTPEDIMTRGGVKCDHGIPEMEKEMKRLADEAKKSIKAMEAVRKKRNEIIELCKQYEANGYEVVKIYDNLNNVKLIHKECGRIYKTDKSTMKKGHGCVTCAKCGTSFGVQQIEKYLRENGVKFDREVKFDSCKRKRPLPFDFAIYDSSNQLVSLIEFNGEQHYRATDYFGGNKKLKKIQESDRIKMNWCKKNNITLKVIKFNDDIESVLKTVIGATQ